MISLTAILHLLTCTAVLTAGMPQPYDPIAELTANMTARLAENKVKRAAPGNCIVGVLQENYNVRILQVLNDNVNTVLEVHNIPQEGSKDYDILDLHNTLEVDFGWFSGTQGGIRRAGPQRLWGVTEFQFGDQQWTDRWVDWPHLCQSSYNPDQFQKSFSCHFSC